MFRRQFVDTVVTRDGRIVSLQTLGGLTVTAAVFIDASYEGDLLARAGVSYTVGREGNEVYGETANGQQMHRRHQFAGFVDPYVVPGEPASGVLPGIEADGVYARGAGDGRLQAYNEGDVQWGGMRPYPVSYRSIVPRRAECTNLLVLFCLSASHRTSAGAFVREPAPAHGPWYDFCLSCPSMRITIVQGAFLPAPPLLGGGVEKMWFGLAPEFVRAGHEVTYISRRYESLPDEETRDGVRHVRVRGFDAPKSKLLYRACDFVYARRARRALPAADIVITNTIFLPLFIRDPRVGKLCVHVARFPKGQMRLYRHADRLQTVSQAVEQAIAAELPAVAAKVKVIPPFLSSDPPRLTPEALDAPREPWVLYLGRVHPEKGLDLLMRAFGDFIKSTPVPWRLKIVGPVAAKMGGGGDAYKARLDAISEPFRDRVDWLGYVGNEELNAVCQRAAAFVYPSLAEKGESFGLAPLEAMSQGCPAIVSDLACFRDFLADGQTGLVFDHRAADAPAALGAQLRRLAADPGLYRRLVHAGYAQAWEFTRERVAGMYLEDFEALLGGTR